MPPCCIWGKPGLVLRCLRSKTLAWIGATTPTSSLLAPRLDRGLLLFLPCCPSLLHPAPCLSGPLCPAEGAVFCCAQVPRQALPSAALCLLPCSRTFGASSWAWLVLAFAGEGSRLHSLDPAAGFARVSVLRWGGCLV